jgi:hypothetical protein
VVGKLHTAKTAFAYDPILRLKDLCMSGAGTERVP